MTSDNNQYCDICRRGEDVAGKLFSLPNNMHLCSDCMRNMLDTMGKMDVGSFFSKGMPFNIGGVPPFTGNDGAVNSDAKNAGTATSEPDKVDSDETKPVEVEVEEEYNAADINSAKNRPSDNDKGNSSDFYGGMPFGGFPNVSFLNMSDLQSMLSGKPRVKKKKNVPDEEKVPLIDIKDIPKPNKIKEMLDEYIVGQDRAKKIVSVGVYNHYKRIAADGMKDADFASDLKDVEIEKSNMLMIGPTGCGKTYMVKTLAKLLNVPLAIADATSLTEAGYIGDDIESVVGKLLSAADNDVEKAETGIIYIDEIDKLAKKKDTHTRDINGESVQQGMLKLLEGAEIEVPVGSNSKNAMVPLATVNTKHILFICGGSFPDLDEIIKQRLRKQTSIGFNAELKDALDKRKDILSEVKVEDIKKYGMIPEFLGRLPIIYTMEGLSKEQLVKILKEPKNALIKQYKKLLSLDEVDLEFEDAAMEVIADKAFEKDTGARALRSIVEEYMLDIMYEIPKDSNIGKVIITKDYVEGVGGPQIIMRGN